MSQRRSVKFVCFVYFFINEIKPAHEFLSWIMPVVLDVKNYQYKHSHLAFLICSLMEVIRFYLLKLRSVVHFSFFLCVENVKYCLEVFVVLSLYPEETAFSPLGNFCSCVKEQLTGFEEGFFWALWCFSNKCVSSFISATLSCKV